MNAASMEPRTVAEWVAQFLVARSVDRIFGLQGGHIQPIWDHLARKGVRPGMTRMVQYQRSAR